MSRERWRDRRVGQAMWQIKVVVVVMLVMVVLFCIACAVNEEERGDKASKTFFGKFGEGESNWRGPG